MLSVGSQLLHVCFQMTLQIPRQDESIPVRRLPSQRRQQGKGENSVFQIRTLFGEFPSGRRCVYGNAVEILIVVKNLVHIRSSEVSCRAQGAGAGMARVDEKYDRSIQFGAWSPERLDFIETLKNEISGKIAVTLVVVERVLVSANLV